MKKSIKKQKTKVKKIVRKECDCCCEDKCRQPSNKSKDSKVEKIKKLSRKGAFKNNKQEKKGFFARLFGK